mmetsp:Transcript_9059/g.31890  ORF Transcript_9059/g.31890 Transcript_9059/m.31890 type:complete len:857 (-) Transcript_9059:45-2615(-)
MPLSCGGVELEAVKLPLVTLIDALDTLAVLGDASEFVTAVGMVATFFKDGFDYDVDVSVFETTIRILGGLLSAHLMASDADLRLFPGYDDSLLDLAFDLGIRLLPAFATPTGIPYGTVNLRSGVPKGESTVSNLAGAGSLAIEFGALSILTHDARFGSAGRGAVKALHDRRSTSLGLLGKHVNIRTGKWTESLSGIGSNSDSFYEYLLKHHLLFGDASSASMFANHYSAVLRHSRRGDWYSDIDMFSHSPPRSKMPRRDVFEALQAFWPGLQAGAGDLRLAARTLNSFYTVFQDWGALPEEYDFWNMKLEARASSFRAPLRPELAESTYLVYRATRDKSWFQAGRLLVDSLERYSASRCGASTTGNVATSELEDGMPSYFLSETCKYLFLLFDDNSNFLHAPNKSYVFSTEAHPFEARRLRQLAEASWQKPKGAVLVSKLATTDRLHQSAPPAAQAQCARPPWWEVWAYDAQFRDTLEARMAGPSRVFSAGFHRAHLFDEDAPQCARIDAPAVQGGVKDSAFSLAFDAFGENPFDFFVTEDSFKATRGTDSLELSKLDAAVLQVNLKDGNEAKELFITRDGLRLTCTLQINATTIPCAVSEFGQTAMLASLGLEEFEVTGTLMRGRSLRGCEVSAFDPEMAGNIVVVSPGGCSFEDKARNAEASGAAAVVVVNDARSIFVMADAGRPRASGLAAVMASFADAAELDVNVGRRATLKVSKTNVSGPVSLSDGAALVPAGSTPLAKKRLNTRRQAAVGARTITVVAQKGWALVATLDSSEDAFWRVYLTPQEAAPLSEARPNAAAGMPRRANASSWNTNARPKDACAKSDCGIGECAAPSPLAGQRPAMADAGVAHKK